MLLKKILAYHFIPLIIGVFLTFIFIRQSPITSNNKPLSVKSVNELHYAAHFHYNDLTNHVALSIALKKQIPILFGSSELSSNHLDGLAQQFFNKDASKDKFLAVGHAGFQTFAIMSVLAANKALLKNAKLTIILSPGWFEKQYSSGTSLKSFFEYCTPNYLYQINQDSSIDKDTKHYIEKYISTNYDKISKPDATIRLMGKKKVSSITDALNYPFYWLDKNEIHRQEQVDFNLISQKIILETLSKSNTPKYHFYNRYVNWDSLIVIAKTQFKSISNNNDIAVENEYYNSWLKNKPKKTLHFVDKQNNQEFKDFLALINFLKEADCKPLFIITPLNTKAHENLSVLEPTIKDINDILNNNHFKTLDLFTPNLKKYEDGVLEDIMHPYNIGWYQIDKFILENYNDGN
jgi:D-alanine transfer protein